MSNTATTKQPTFSFDGMACSLDAMLEANRDDETVCMFVKSARVGDEFRTGGATGESVLRRVA